MVIKPGNIEFIAAKKYNNPLVTIILFLKKNHIHKNNIYLTV